MRFAEHMTQGIFNYDYRRSSWAREGVLPYMLFELDEETLIRTIQVKLSDHAPFLPADQTELRLGTTMTGGPADFSQLELIGTFDNSQILEWRVFEFNPPKKAKFLAFIEKDQTAFSLLFLEIFS